jgi:hypothetical protein
VRVLERGEDRPFAREALREDRRPAHMRQLKRHLAVEQTIGTLGKPHRTHAADAKFADQAVWAHLGPLGRLAPEVRRLGQQAQRRGGEVAGLGLGMARQQLAQRAGQGPRLVGQRGQPARAIGRGQVERLVEQARQASQVGDSQGHGVM